MTDAQVRSRDDEHLRLLSIFHYLVAAFAALFALFPLFHIGMGIAMLTGRLENAPPDRELAWMGWFFIAMGGAWLLAGLAFAAALVVAGRSLAQRRRYTFCLVVAALACMFVPFGTVLGVLTLVLLLRDSVKAQFDVGRATA